MPFLKKQLTGSYGKIEIQSLKDIEIEFYINHFGTCNLGPLHRSISNADFLELNWFLKRIRQLKSKDNNRTNQAFNDVANFSVFDAIILAAKNEMCKKGKWRYILFILKRKLINLYLKKMRGMEIINNDFLGPICKNKSSKNWFQEDLKTHWCRISYFLGCHKWLTRFFWCVVAGVGYKLGEILVIFITR